MTKKTSKTQKVLAALKVAQNLQQSRFLHDIVLEMLVMISSRRYARISYLPQ